MKNIIQMKWTEEIELWMELENVNSWDRSRNFCQWKDVRHGNENGKKHSVAN